jgi:protein-S-isoprenylcysteine O-methyltransferase Ste14
VTPIPFESLPAGVVFDGLLLLAALVELGIRIRSSVNAARGNARPERLSLAIIVLGMLISVAGSLLVARHVTAAAIPFARWGFYVAGVVAIAAGIALRVWAVVVLGRFFTVEVRVGEDQRVVDTGPYRVIRHPSYTGLLLVILGLGLGLGNWLALAVAVVPAVAALVYRIRVEEAALLAGLGDAYRRYSEGRARLVPGVW